MKHPRKAVLIALAIIYVATCAGISIHFLRSAALTASRVK